MKSKNLLMINIKKPSRKRSLIQKSVLIKFIDFLKDNLTYDLQLIRTSIRYTSISKIKNLLADFFIHLPLCFVFYHLRYNNSSKDYLTAFKCFI
jgi:hypothetical protein